SPVVSLLVPPGPLPPLPSLVLPCEVEVLVLVVLAAAEWMVVVLPGPVAVFAVMVSLVAVTSVVPLAATLSSMGLLSSTAIAQLWSTSPNEAPSPTQSRTFMRSPDRLPVAQELTAAQATSLRVGSMPRQVPRGISAQYRLTSCAGSPRARWWVR